MSQDARLVLRDNPSKSMSLSRSKPTTIGKAESNRLRLATLAGVSDHHAVVRFSLSQGWLVCDWQSTDGTFLEGERIRQCRHLSDGDEIQLGAEGPVLVFRLLPVTAPAAPPTPVAAGGSARPSGAGVASSASAGPGASRSTAAHAAAASPRQGGSGSDSAAAAAARNRNPPASTAATGSQGSSRPGGAASVASSSLTIGGRSIPLDQIRSAHVRSRQRYPNSFSWWVLLCLGGMVLLPFQWLFWGVEIAALAAWILLGSRKQHLLVITLRDGMAFRHDFNNRITALSHRNGIRKAIGQSLEAG